MLDTVCFVSVGAFRGKLVSTYGAFVLLCDLPTLDGLVEIRRWDETSMHVSRGN